MKKYIIEREIPGIGSLKPEEYRAAAAKSNQALAKLSPAIEWIESFVTADKTFCVYRAEDEMVIRKHAELSGFPANKITEVNSRIDPCTADASKLTEPIDGQAKQRRHDAMPDAVAVVAATKVS
jgi:Protein of unknown function (DUF4242)